MKLYVRRSSLVVALAGALVLAGCGSGTDTPAAQPSTSTATLPEPPMMGREIQVLAFGDSLFAGYGLKSTESYPARLEAALRARGINARIANAGVSGNTTADGLARLAFTLDGQAAKPELVIVGLGGNDMLRSLPPAQARANLDAILAELKKRGIKAVLMGMLAPPNLGADYRTQFDAIYPALAKQHGAVLVPFFLQAVVGKPDLVQQDHLHPSARGVEEIVASTVETVAGALPKDASSTAPPSPR